jgi:hypothetical protein
VARLEWFVYQNGTPPTGPTSSPKILEMRERGELDAGALLYPVEGGEWKLLADLLPVLQARCQEVPYPWFIFREGRPPLGPLDDELLRRGIDAGKVPRDALLSRANGVAWYSQARALAEPTPSPAPAEDGEERQVKTALRAAVAPPAPPDPVTRERMILAAFCATPLVLGALIALLVR